MIKISLEATSFYCVRLFLQTRIYRCYRIVANITAPSATRGCLIQQVVTETLKGQTNGGTYVQQLWKKAKLLPGVSTTHDIFLATFE